jgi:homoprotocatechuate degradation regulator HpaR
VNDEPRRLLPEDLLLPRDTRRSLPIALLKAREAVMSRFRPMLNAHDVTEQQWRVIRILGEAGEPLEATDLADRACVLAPSLTRIIKTLEDRGVITRQRHETDGRRVLLEITPAGVALIRSVTPESAKIYVELEARFGRERLDQLLDLLEILTRNGGR